MLADAERGRRIGRQGGSPAAIVELRGNRVVLDRRIISFNPNQLSTSVSPFPRLLQQPCKTTPNTAARPITTHSPRHPHSSMQRHSQTHKVNDTGQIHVQGPPTLHGGFLVGSDVHEFECTWRSKEP